MTEHGPFTRGDEIKSLKLDQFEWIVANFGWPIASYGYDRLYNHKRKIFSNHKENGY